MKTITKIRPTNMYRYTLVFLNNEIEIARDLRAMAPYRGFNSFILGILADYVKAHLKRRKDDHTK